MRKVVLLVVVAVFKAFAAPVTKETVRGWLTELASARMEGRGTASEGGARAADYIVARFREAGLKPAFGDSFRQRVPVVRLELAGRPSLLVNGTPCKKGWGVTVLGSGGEVEAEVVFCGYGISAPELGYDDYAGVNVKGKAVIFLRGAPRWGSKKTPFQGRSVKHVTLSEKVSVASKHGACAVLIVSGLKKDDKAARAHLAPPAVRRSHSSKLPPVLLVSPKLARRILGKAPADLARKIDATLKPCSFCTATRIKLSVPLVEKTTYADNIAGILEGTDNDLKGRYIVVGAHYDHLGRRGGKIFYGADDNASGTVCVMALAHLMHSDNPPKRSLLFVCFTGEEWGFIGSRYFVEHMPVDKDAVAMMLNFDMVGRGLGGKICFFGAAGQRLTERLAKDAARRENLIARCTPFAGYRSDQASFLRENIPAIFIYCSRNPDYHTPRDTADKIDYENLWKVIRVAQRFVSALANYDGVLTPWRRDGLPNLGLFLEEHKDGLLVRKVLRHSPAGRAGVRSGDTIVAADAKPCRTSEEFEKVLKAAGNKRCISLTLLRKSKRRKLKIALPRRRKQNTRSPKLPIR
ncbi:MAG: hypothetical protein DRP82_01175 [Planctomycetota bacterium]|nr:MAG: hypothetical protein DRP82_01175 [Planctomycetota bacterium]